MLGAPLLDAGGEESRARRLHHLFTCAAAQRERDSTIATAGGGGVRVSSAHGGVLRAARELREEVRSLPLVKATT